MLAIAGLWFNQIQKGRDQKAAEAQKQREENAAKEREKLERESREDNQREVALQAYLDKMSELILEKKLRDSAEEDEIRKIARVRTLTVLRRLDPIRKASVIQFLHESGLIDKDADVLQSVYESGLINKDTRIISLEGADLSRRQPGRCRPERRHPAPCQSARRQPERCPPDLCTTTALLRRRASIPTASP